MKHRFTLALLLAGLLALASTPARAQYAAWEAAPAANNAAYVRSQGGASATDADGNTYLIGNLCGSALFGPFPLQIGGPVFNMMCGNEGSFLAKVDAAGQWQWVRPLESVYTSALVADNQGHLYLTGVFFGSAVVGTTPLLSQGESDVMVGRLSAATGDWEWVTSMGGTVSERVSALALTPTGTLYVAGEFESPTLTVGTTLLTRSANPRNLFLAHLTTTGRWLGAAGVDAGMAYPESIQLTADATGDAYLTSQCSSGLLEFGNLAVISRKGSFVARFGAAAQDWQWAKIIPRATTTALAVGRGQLYVAGRFNDSTLQLGTTLLTNPAYPAATIPISDLFAAALPLTGGNWQWAVDAGQAQANALAVDTTGNLYLTGALVGPARFGATSLSKPPTPIYNSLFVAALSAGGGWRWAAQDTSTMGNSAGNGLGVDAAGRLFVGGYNSLWVSMHGEYSGQAIVARVLPGSVLGLAAPGAAALTLSPNPAHATARLTLPAPAPQAELLDALGRVVRRVALPAGQRAADLDLTGLPPGLYSVRAGGLTRRLVVE